MTENNKQLLKLVVMSDIHLGPEGRIKLGLDTADRFQCALDSAASRNGDADMCIFAGDIADEAEEDAYLRFDQMRSQLALEQKVMLGNHDHRETYLKLAKDPMLDENGHVQGFVDLKGHRVLMLDTSEPGHVDGILCQKRLDWAAVRLSEAYEQDLKVVLILHHNPCALQMPVDTYRLTNPEELLAVMHSSKAAIIQVLAGHCHITTAGSWGGYPSATLGGNQHHVEVYLRGRTGHQHCYEGPAQYAVLVSDGVNCALHFENYVNRNIQLPDAMLPWKRRPEFAPL